MINNVFVLINVLFSIGLALLPAVRVRADDPDPLEIDRVVRLIARGGIRLGMGELQPELVPMADGPGDIRRIPKGLSGAVLIALEEFKPHEPTVSLTEEVVIVFSARYWLSLYRTSVPQVRLLN